MHPYLNKIVCVAVGFILGLLLVPLITRKRVAMASFSGAKRYRLLTLSACLVMLLAVIGAMYFMHAVIGLHSAYWIVPVFGALGGLVGSLIRNANHLTLVTFDPQNYRIRLGFIGDIVLGLGGAAVVAFLFENTLNFDPEKKASYPLMISVCFIAGVFGQLLIEIAGEKVIAKEALSIAKEALPLAKEAGKDVKEVGKETEALKSSASSAFVVASLYKFDKAQFDEALEAANESIKLDPNNSRAIVAKGRALKRLGKVGEALTTVDSALSRSDLKLSDPDRGALLYNKACYNLLQNPTDVQGTLALLELAFSLRPECKKAAVTDGDLRGLWEDTKFIQLTGDEPRQN